MKKAVLLGDSIRQIGYGTLVPALLCDEFEVWQPDDNCRFAQYLLRGLFDWRARMEGADVVHFNVGHWDLCDLFGDGPFTPIDEYAGTVFRIARILLSRCPNVIFATTCPVRPENRYNRNETIDAFNAAVVPTLTRMGVIINDLHAAASDVERCIRADDCIHLTEEGIRLCAKQTAAVIRAAVK